MDQIQNSATDQPLLPHLRSPSEVHQLKLLLFKLQNFGLTPTLECSVIFLNIKLTSTENTAENMIANLELLNGYT
jgi:hypothetical protein